MNENIEKIELDETNVEFNNALDFVKHTNNLVYLTGKAGTGKTTFLKHLRSITSKNTVVLAFTGVAAINAGGQTINSFFKIPFGPFIPNDKRLRKKPELGDIDRSTVYDYFSYSREQVEIIRNLELIIIDEISMVRCDLLDVVDRLLKIYRKKENEPFGGVQVILIGDTFQLPPIADFEQWEILKPFYESPFFFSSVIIKKFKPVYIELKKIYRQNEQEFIELLNRIRINQVTANELTLLNSKYNPSFVPNKNSNYITLATHNKLVESTNLNKLAELETDLKLFKAVITGTFPANIMSTDDILQLKVGAQVMFIKNDKNKKYYNGKIAKIDKIEDDKIIVEFSDGNQIDVEKQQWNNVRYFWNTKDKKIEEEIIGTFEQLPLKLAWAITVHKSQGLTFDKVIADLGGAFAPGQVYVALSRCTTFSGLVLKSRIEHNAIKTDASVLNFAQNETPNTLLIQELNSGKANNFYKKAREEFNNNNLEEMYDNFIKAIKFRNDIETDIFKKYIITNIRKILTYKTKYQKVLNTNKDTKEELLKTVTLHSVKSIENIFLEQKVEDQNNSIKLLLEKIENVTEENDVQLKSLDNWSKYHAKSESSLKKQLNQIYEYKQKLEKSKHEIQYLNEEISRLNNLKWYDKLFGK